MKIYLFLVTPGSGKSHLSIGLAREWCLTGRKVFYTTAASLVQQLLEAKANLRLRQIIKKFDYFEILIIDDISYISSPFLNELLTLRKISETRINVVILGRIKRKTQEVWLRRYWIYIQTI